MTLPKRDVPALVESLRIRALALTGESWEREATREMMKEAADRLEEQVDLIKERDGLLEEIGALRAKEPPLLQCIDCRNTESPAGAMARYFNQGRCLHCGGFFKVVRA